MTTKENEIKRDGQAAPGEEQIRVNGYAQVLEMLQIADADFRESLLRRLAQRDPALAKSLRQSLARQSN